jgi:hypothetical protein
MYVHTLDIAHPPLRAETAEKVLVDEIHRIRQIQPLRVLKVIHGSGGSKRPGVLKEIVRNWAYRNRKHLRAVIPGEEYHMYNPVVQDMRKTCGQTSDPDLGTGNQGMTLIWVR